jgi:predicted RNA-binding protein with PUA-like domain
MKYWLVKSEPDVYAFSRLEAEGRVTWDGVRNYQARNNLRAMGVGDLCLYYHSNIGLEVVGIAAVSRAFYPDPTANQGDWSAVDLVPVKALIRPVSLADIKGEEALREIALVRNGRLSVMPLTEAEFQAILRMGATTL